MDADTDGVVIVTLKNRKKTPASQWCSAISCKNSRYKNPGLAFFRFPRDEQRCKRWVINSRREDLLNKSPKELFESNVLCAFHFEDSQFTNSKKTLRRLKAVPTIFDVLNAPTLLETKRTPPKERHSLEPNKTCPSSEQHQPESPQPKPSLSDTFNVDNVKIQSLKKKINTQRKTIKRLTLKSKPKGSKVDCEKKKQEVEYLKSTSAKYMKSEAHRFFSKQLDMSIMKGKRWNAEDKSHALSLYHASPKAYTLLQKQFNLPSVDTLKRVMRKINIYPGFPENIMSAFRNKVHNMTDNDKKCMLVFDEICLKSSLRYNSERDYVEGFEDFGFLGRSGKEADHAIVFLARGLFSKWKQPFGYFLSQSTIKPSNLKTLVFSALDSLKSIGLVVKGVICDQGSNNRAVFRSLNVTEQEPVFFHNGDSVLVFFDPPHLLKNIRNNLSKTDFYIDQDVISWNVVKDFYEKDIKFPLRWAPKLKGKHINLPTFSHLRVSLAAQVLSHAVARGISCMCEVNILPSSHRATATFIERFDRLFNVFNSHGGKTNAPFKHPISSSSTHIAFLNETLEWLNKLKYGDPHKPKSADKLPCIRGWMQTIRALLLLVKDVTGMGGNKYVLTNRLNQDCLENLFAIIRSKGGHRVNPDPHEFRLALRQIMVDRFFFFPSSRANCKEDVDTFLLNLSAQPRELVSQQPPTSQENVRLVSLLQSAKLEDLIQLENVISYVAGYILKKIKPLICEKCLFLLEEKDDLQQRHLALIRAKTYEHCSGDGLTKPSSKLVEAIALFEATFQTHCQQNLCREGLRHYLSLKLNALQCTQHLKSHNCKCNTPVYVASLFLKVRINHELMLKNDALTLKRKHSGKKVSKLAKLSHE